MEFYFLLKCKNSIIVEIRQVVFSEVQQKKYTVFLRTNNHSVLEGITSKMRRIILPENIL